MRYLSLFTGVGGGDLAFQHLLGWECIGYVEWDQYCQRVIAQRVADGIFDRAPIFGDVREFVQSGAANEYRGVADVVTGGFPCQPFSEAGNKYGADDPRNMWPATLDCIRTIRPRFAFMENVTGLLNSGYFGTVLGDLAEGGYDARWRILSAAEVGAPHLRERIWIVAYPTGKQQWIPGAGRRVQGSATIPKERGRLLRRFGDSDLSPIGHPWWKAEPDVQRMGDGDATWTDRHRAIGNGIVPQVAATAWRLLTEAL